LANKPLSAGRNALGLFPQTLRLLHEQFFQSGILEKKSSQHGVAPYAGGSAVALSATGAYRKSVLAGDSA
jgi:hypothetical protein